MIELILGYSLTLWMGLYLISRDVCSLRLRFAGLSFVVYAAGIALKLFDSASPNQTLLVMLATALWASALWIFLRGELSARYRWLLLLGLPLFLLQGILPALIMSLALSMLGIAAAAVDARERGEGLLPDVFRSFDYAAFMCLIFGGQVAVAMSIVGVSVPLVALLLSTITAAIVIQVFIQHAQTLLDHIAFFRWARLRTARADLRAVADALPRVAEASPLEQMSEDEFNRCTRRALSHFGDLPRLAGNPLIYLPVIETRLAQRHATDNTLERAVELKGLLAESIARLKPRTNSDFGTTNEWRHYNALYYPYIVGLKPYSVRAEYDDGLQAVWQWFSTHVPERTLYNWQTAATKLVARDLREQQQVDLTP